MARFREGAAAGERSGIGAELKNKVFVFGEKIPLFWKYGARESLIRSWSVGCDPRALRKESW